MDGGDTDLVYLTLVELAKADAVAADLTGRAASNLRRRDWSGPDGSDRGSGGGGLSSSIGSAGSGGGDPLGSPTSASLLTTVLAEPRAVNLLRLYYQTRAGARDHTALQHLLLGANLPVAAATSLVRQAHLQIIVAQRLHFVHEAATLLAAAARADGGGGGGRRASISQQLSGGGGGDPNINALKVSQLFLTDIFRPSHSSNSNPIISFISSYPLALHAPAYTLTPVPRAPRPQDEPRRRGGIGGDAA